MLRLELKGLVVFGGYHLYFWPKVQLSHHCDCRGQYFGSVESEKGLNKRKDSTGLSLNDSILQNFLVIRITMFGETYC